MAKEVDLKHLSQEVVELESHSKVRVCACGWEGG